MTPQLLMGYGLAAAAPQTWNPSDKSSNIVLSGGDLVATRDASADAYRMVRAVRGCPATVNLYWEVTITALPSADFVLIGLANAAASLDAPGANTGDNGWGYAIREGALYGSGFQTRLPGTLPTAGVGDVLMFARDGGGTFTIGKNGTWFLSGDPTTSTNPTATSATDNDLFPAVGMYRSGYSVTANFSGPFVYTPPTGFAGFP